MTNSPVTIRQTDTDPDLFELLKDSDLPTGDIRKDKTLFVEAVRNTDRIGIGALQMEGNVGLLRSLVVRGSHQGEGHGSRLVETLVDSARHRNLDALYLLTTEAASFFDRLGFEEISRQQLPSSIQSTRQVQTLCPDSATCMRLDLSGSSADT